MSTLILAIFCQIWGFSQSCHLQKIQKNFQIQLSSFEVGLKQLIFMISRRIFTKNVHAYKKNENRHAQFDTFLLHFRRLETLIF